MLNTKNVCVENGRRQNITTFISQNGGFKKYFSLQISICAIFTISCFLRHKRIMIGYCSGSKEFYTQDTLRTMMNHAQKIGGKQNSLHKEQTKWYLRRAPWKKSVGTISTYKTALFFFTREIKNKISCKF